MGSYSNSWDTFKMLLVLDRVRLESPRWSWCYYPTPITMMFLLGFVTGCHQDVPTSQSRCYDVYVTPSHHDVWYQITSTSQDVKHVMFSMKFRCFVFTVWWWCFIIAVCKKRAYLYTWFYDDFEYDILDSFRALSRWIWDIIYIYTNEIRYKFW